MSNITLPVYAQRNEIVSAVCDNSVVIITAETGAGKSTQVPQYLLEEGYNLVVTQPRRLAARTVAARVAEEFGTPLGEVVGFRTAYERQDSEATRCLFVTDGLALVRELMGVGHHTVLVLDEVHEWNLNIEVLVAWTKRQIKDNASFKVVLMSATLEADRLRAYFGGVPIINVPGRTFPVEEQAPVGRELEDDVAQLLKQGRNVLVFQPGKREIGETIAELTHRTEINAEILPLHGELTPEEQAKCFRTYGRPKCVVSTNVAQTSVTIADIDAVVDAGTERRIELVDGIEGLYLKSISLADRKQRMGRAGRTKSGVYIDRCPSIDRLEFPKAEILRVRLDQTVLRLAEAGLDAEALEFFHQPDHSEIREARRALIALGCMDSDGQVTKVGRRIAKLPISVKYGRMVVEAENLGVVDDVISVAAIMEQGGITARTCPMHQEQGYKNCACWQRLAPGEVSSDVIAQLLAYKTCEEMTKDEMREGGIFLKAFYQAKEKRRHLADALRGKVKEFSSSGRREDILKAVCSGMVDHLFRNDGYGRFQNGGGYRELGNESVIPSATWLIGEPWDLQIQTRRGPRVLNLIRMASKVEPAWLAEVAPQLVEVKAGINPRYDASQDDVVSTTETWFNGQLVESHEILDATHPEAAHLRRDGRNLKAWQNWADKPEIVLPDLADESALIPEIVVCTYGADVEDGTPLVAYGVVVYNSSRWYSSDPWFRATWTREESEAKLWHEQAIAKLSAVRAEAKAVAERQRLAEEVEQLKSAAEPLRQQIVELYRRHSYNYDLPDSMRSKLYYAQQFPWTCDVQSMKEWTAVAEAFIVEVNATLAAVEAHKTELAETAKVCRDTANNLLVEHGNVFDDELYERLAQLDVDDDALPVTIERLEAWIARANAAISEATKATNSSRPADKVDLSALALMYRPGRN